MMQLPLVHADFHNADQQGRLRLNSAGTLRDPKQHGMEFHPGLRMRFYSDDASDAGEQDNLVVDGVVEYSAEENCWVATVDWNAVRHESDEHRA
jgi:hypothetical protein